MLRYIPGIIQIVFVEFLVIILLASVSSRWVAAHGALGCGPSGIAFDWKSIIYILLAGVGAFWILYRIFVPKLVVQRFRTMMKIGPIAGFTVSIPNPAIPATSYLFCSTHPAYALVELGVLLPLLLVYRMGYLLPTYTGCGGVFYYFFGRAILGLYLGFPLVRLFSWYVLKRKLNTPETKIAFQSSLFILAVAIPIYLSIPLMVYVPLWRAPHLNEQSFAGGLSKHPEFIGKTVRVSGRMKSPKVALCHCSQNDPTSCRFASILLDMGQGGDVVIRGVSNNADSLRALADSKDALSGKTISFYGVIQPLPTKEEIAIKRYEFLSCGWEEFGTPPRTGRAYLDVEIP